MMKNPTINYYNENAISFTENTRNIDFHIIQDKFLSLLPDNATILDLGCGAGRDTKYFLDRGYYVFAIDGSERLCRLASEYTGIEVKHMMFQGISEECAYDGIWSCASLLHVPSVDLCDILMKVKRALKPEGILYLSFKYGEFEGYRNGRYFVDMTEEKFAQILGRISGLHMESQEITTDARPDRDDRWLNIILRKEA